MPRGRPKRDVHEDDKLQSRTMTLSNKHCWTLDWLAQQMRVSGRSATNARLLEGVEQLVRSGKLSVEDIMVASLRNVSPGS